MTTVISKHKGNHFYSNALQPLQGFYMTIYSDVAALKLHQVITSNISALTFLRQPIESCTSAVDIKQY